MKLFQVDLYKSVIAAAEDEGSAYDAVQDEMTDIKLETEFTFDVLCEVKDGTKLPDGWSKECIPYGGDGNTRIKDFKLA